MLHATKGGLGCWQINAHTLRKVQGLMLNTCHVAMHVARMR